MRNNYYVYLHKTKEGIPFYVGKGKNKRAYSYTNRSENWNDYVNKIGDYDIEIYKNNLSENDALELEKNLIEKIGINNLTNVLERGYVSGESEEYIKAKQSLNDFINLCDLYYSL
jgi:predicted GIY-YIG superfamily endonuclease